MAFGSIWKFGADNSEYKKAVREMPSELDKSARQIEQRTKEMGSRMSGAMRELQSFLVGGALAAGMAAILKKMGDIDDMARRFGASAEDVQRVGNAAQLVGNDLESVVRTINRAGVAANRAAREGGALAESFARIDIDPAAFAAAGLADRVRMVAAAQQAANGDAQKLADLYEVIGVRAANINFAELAAEMEGVAAASQSTVDALARADDLLDRARQNATVFGATLLASINDFSERIGSVLAQDNGLLRLMNGVANAFRGNFQPLFQVLGTSKTIAEMEEIELRAQAIAQLTREGLLQGDDAEQARLIAERMEQIRQKLEGNKTIVSDINDDLAQANSLEKEKTSELERQQRLLEQQETRRKEAIKDAQFEVDLIEAKLRGDKARVAALEEQRDFEQALEKTGSTEVAASLAAAKAAERAAQDAARTTAAPSGSASSSATPQVQTALEALRQAAETSPAARAALGRIEADQARAGARSANLRGFGGFTSAANAEIRAERRAERSAQRALERMVQEAAKTEKQRAEETKAAEATGASARPSDPMSAMAGDIKEIKDVLTKADGIHDRLPIRVLAA